MRIQLGQGSRLELTAQAGRVFESGVGAAFRVCDEHPEAALAAQLEALGQVGRAVVHAVQDVKVTTL